MVVVDASIIVKWFVPEPGHLAARQLLRSGQDFIAPDFVILETANVLRRKAKRGEITTNQYHQLSVALHRFFDRLLPSTGLIQSAANLAVRLDHDVYDCAYLACAIQQSAQLATADDVFARKAVANGFQSRIVLL